MCGEHKLDSKSKAEDIYTSPRFKRDLRYAKTLTAEENIFILSAEHHLLSLKQEIEPYNRCLDDMTQTELDEWSNTVLTALKIFADFETDKFVIIAEDIYKRGLRPHLKHIEEINFGEDE